MPRLHAITRARGLGIGALLLGGALAASGCGAAKRDANPDVITGKVLFVQRCGACHTLSRAGTKGVIGPNLDYAFAQSLADGEKRSALEAVVHDQILIPNPNGAMPANLVKGKDVANVASYVAQVAAKPGQDTGLLATSSGCAGKPAVETAGKLEIDADPSGQLCYVSQKATASTGAVTVTMKNTGTTTHNIALQQGTAASGPVLGAGPIVGPGGLSTFKATLQPGTYTYFCQVPGHRAAGMLGTITVK